jgi:hypothetical protein
VKRTEKFKAVMKGYLEEAGLDVGQGSKGL